VRSRSLRYVFAVTAAVVCILALTTAGFSQAAPAGQGQAAPSLNSGGGQQAPQAQQGGRAQRPAPPSAPAPRRADGRIIIGAVPGQAPGGWSGGATTLPQGILEKIPFQPWAKAVYDQRQIDQFEPHTRCKASGAARQFATPYGTEFVEIADLKRIYIMDNGGPHSFRIIYMDGRQHPTDLVPTNYGHSIGRWEGDTLVVDTVGFNEKFWIDTRGTPHTEQLHYVERFTRKDMNTLEYIATIDDPGAYTQPWTTNAFTLRWRPNSDPFEYVCQDNNHGPELMLGSQEEVDRTRIFVP
jgi:hypothetical protein